MCVQMAPLQVQGSPWPPLAPSPPNTTTSFPSVAIVAYSRALGPCTASCVQHPSQIHVSPRKVSVGMYGKPTNITLVSFSLAMEALAPEPGPTAACWAELVPSHAHVSLRKFGAEVPPLPNSPTPLL